MHVQPRVNPLARSDFFPDQRGARPLVDGTVARGDLRADTYFYTGKIGSNPGDYMPFPVTKEVLERGRDASIFIALPVIRLSGMATDLFRPAVSAQAALVSHSAACRKPRWDISST